MHNFQPITSASAATATISPNKHRRKVSFGAIIKKLKWLQKLDKLFLHWFAYKVSLRQQYITFSIGVIGLTLITSAWLTFSTYQEIKAEQEFFLEKEGLRLNFELHQHLLLTENVLLVLADKVARNNDYSPTGLVTALGHERRSFYSGVFSWDHISYIDPKGHLTMANFKGLFKSSIYSGEEVGWRRTAKYLPFKLQFSPPSLSPATAELIIPAAIGMVDKKGKFKGYIGSEITINKLQESLMKVIGHSTGFIMLDDDLHFIASSDSKLTPENINIPVGSIREVMHHKYIDPKKLAYQVRIGGNTYTHYICSERYPFIFLVGQNEEEYYNRLWQQTAPQIARNVISGLLFLGILLVLGYQVTRPIVQLGRVADYVSKNKSVRIPSYKVQELNTLAEQLAAIQQIHGQLHINQAQLTKSNHELQHANEFIRSNMSFLSHELKNPICSILGLGQILKDRLDKAGDTEDQECIAMLHSAAVYQNRQIDFFLNLFRFQEQGRRMESVPLDLDKLIYNNINMVRHHILKNEVKVETEITPGLPKLIGDEIMISQMIQNLAANGAKYNKMGGTLTIRAFTRYNNTSRCEIVLQFRDTGIGIAVEDLDLIFDKFQRIRSNHTRDICGYGIGLSYAKHCAVLHDGEIKVKSRLGVGTEFSVIFPKFRICDTDMAVVEPEGKNEAV